MAQKRKYETRAFPPEVADAIEQIAQERNLHPLEVVGQLLSRELAIEAVVTQSVEAGTSLPRLRVGSLDVTLHPLDKDNTDYAAIIGASTSIPEAPVKRGMDHKTK